MSANWANLIVPIMGAAIIAGAGIVAWVSIRARGSRPRYTVAKPPKSSSYQINPKTGGRY
ncbi:MAG: hypothetical protein H3C51_13510 [Rubellimicrobium sp.]|nr:hypothetical protein [Rubellimicrobium sp.]